MKEATKKKIAASLKKYHSCARKAKCGKKNKPKPKAKPKPKPKAKKAKAKKPKKPKVKKTKTIKKKVKMETKVKKVVKDALENEKPKVVDYRGYVSSDYDSDSDLSDWYEGWEAPKKKKKEEKEDLEQTQKLVALGFLKLKDKTLHEEYRRAGQKLINLLKK